MRRVLPLVFVLSCLTWTSDVSAATCEELARAAFPNTRISSAETIAAGSFVPPAAPGANIAPIYKTLPAFCRVRVALTPSSDSDIRTEVWLPTANWNGKLQAVGNGGWAGTIPYAAMAAAVVAGYATTGTDTGHVGNSADFVPGHPEKLVDFGYRAIHEMTVASKAIIRAHYGDMPKVSYFNGCSQGGRQAITSAQRYPQDYDGIVAGASAWNSMRMHGARIVVNRTMNRTPDAVIPPDKYPMIHTAVLNACDGLDGVQDGVIENPTKCSVDFKALECKGEDASSCLTPAQVESARAIVSPVTHPTTGAVLFEGHLWPGAELEWDTIGGPKPLANAVTGVRNVAFNDPGWDPTTFAAGDIDLADRADKDILDSNNANLKPFFDRGGKLLMWHGWADPQVTPQNSTIYFTNVLKTVGRQAEDSIALFMLPGVYHCGGGPGPDRFDRMAAIEQWVEGGRKPTRIVASHQTNGTVDRTRPLCPFGEVARWNGSGSTDDEKNFSCVAETVDTSVRLAPSAPRR